MYDPSTPNLTYNLLEMSLSNKSAINLEELSAPRLEYRERGIFEFIPRAPEKRAVVLSCGIHGNETAPIEILTNLCNAILTKKTELNCHLLVIFGNLEAIKAGKRFVDVNMNRLFGTTESQGKQIPEMVRALTIQEEVSDFFNSHPQAIERTHYDLHTAIRDSYFDKFAIQPYIAGKQHIEQSQKIFLQACGVKAVVLSHKPSSTFSAFTSREHLANSFTIELGKVYAFGKNPHTITQEPYEALSNVIGENNLKENHRPLKVFKVKHEIIKQTKAFKLYISDDTPNFTIYEENTLLAEDESYQYLTSSDSERIIFPNPLVHFGHRAGLVIEESKIHK